MVHEEYKATFRQSWSDLIKNPVLFVPSIFMFVGTLILVFLFFATSGIIGYLQHQPIYFRENPIADLFIGVPLKTIIFFIIYVVLEFVVSSYISGMKNGMAKDIIEKGSTSVKEGFTYANKFFLKVISLEFMLVAILLPPILIFVNFKTAATTENFTGYFFLLMFACIFIIYFIYMTFNLIFVYPVMFVEKKSSFKTISTDFHYVKTHFLHTLISWLLIIGTFFFFYLAKLPFDRIANYTTSILIILGAFLLIYILEVIFSNWEHLFVMRAYLAGKTEKETEEQTEKQTDQQSVSIQDAPKEIKIKPTPKKIYTLSKKPKRKNKKKK